MRKIRAVCCSHTGNVRPQNEDNFTFCRDMLRTESPQKEEAVLAASGTNAAFGVFDGLGGLKESERASARAAETFRALMKKGGSARCSGEYLRACCMEINAGVCALSDELGHATGTTGVLLFLNRKSYAVANVGDSPAYLYRNCHLRRIFQEHSDRQLIEQLGIRKTPSLTQHLGLRPEKMELDPFSAEDCSYLGDRFVLCTDGLNSVVPEEKIEAICHDHKDTADCVATLIKAALNAGGPDNITVIVCDVVE